MATTSALRTRIVPQPVGWRRLQSNVWVLAVHVLLALFVAFHAYPATQDGPAHLYGAHIVRSLQSDPLSPYMGYFESNLRPASNSLFTYLVLAAAGRAPLEWVTRIVMLLALLGVPFSAIAFSRALGRQTLARASGRVPETSAAVLGCLIAYNYFTYRGLFNYALSVPLVFACLSALLEAGHAGHRRASRGLLGLCALLFGLLAALAHPSAIAFLLLAVPLACLRAASLQRWLGLAVFLLLLGFASVSSVSVERPPSPVFSDFASSILSLVRALGVTLTWLEVVPALLLLGLIGRAALQGLPPLRRLWIEWEIAWPILLALGLLLCFFAIPYEYGGAAGVNERVPLFAAMLLLPFVRFTPKMRLWSLPGFLAFSIYTVVERVQIDRTVERARESRAAAQVPRGSVIYAVTLRVKLGALSVDLGRHLLADVMRQYDLVAGTVFCHHPAHVLRCTKGVPAAADATAIQAFEHLSPDAQRAALDDPNSPIRRSFAIMSRGAGRAQYLLVLGADNLNAAFERFVCLPLGARRISEDSEPIRIYELAPQPIAAVEPGPGPRATGE